MEQHSLEFCFSAPMGTAAQVWEYASKREFWMDFAFMPGKIKQEGKTNSFSNKEQT